MRKFTFALALTVGAQLVPIGIFAQDVAAESPQAGVVRGTVVAKLSGAALSHAVVTIEALNQQQFSNDQGKFYFIKVKPGTYRLNVRQLGYLPVNKDIVVDASGTASITVEMDRIATKLAAFTVTDQAVCTTPGRPTEADGQQIVDVFEQLEQNAIRLALLARQYPYALLVERRFTLRDSTGEDRAEHNDMMTREGQQKALYKPGQVVKRVSGTYSLQIPTLLDFTDRAFVDNHCFTLRGVESFPTETGGDGTTLVRVDFTASGQLKNPDVEGSVFLDTADYRLRRTEIRLSRVPNNIPEVAGVKVTTTFQDYVPGMPMISLIQATTEMKRIDGKPFKVQSRSEQQIVANVLFRKDHPGPAGAPTKK